MSNTYPPPPPPPGGHDPQEPFAASSGEVPPPPPPPPAAYGQMPGEYAPPAAPVATRPQAMENAVRLMRLGGLVSLLSLLTLFFASGAMRDAIAKAMREADPTVTQQTIDTFVGMTVAMGVVSGLLGAALWFWMAAMNGRGRSWARVVATVFFGIQVLTFLFGLAQPQPALSRILSFVILAIGAAAIFFMYKKESSDYYAAMSRPRP